MQNISTSRIAVVGAGISGLAAYRRLRQLGADAVVFDKAKGLGGRAATRRVERWSADIGAQFTTGQDEEWLSILQGCGDELKTVTLPSDPRYPRYIHRRGMSAIAHALVNPYYETKRVRLGVRAVSLNTIASSVSSPVWQLVFENGESVEAEAVILALPVPQALEIIRHSGYDVTPDIQQAVAPLVYQCCLAAVIEPTAHNASLSFPPLWKNPSPQLEGIYWQKGKGIGCADEVIVVHCAAEFSIRHWDVPREEQEKAIRTELLKVTGGHNLFNAMQIHRWRYSTPSQLYPEPYLEIFIQNERHGRLLLAGDAFQRAAVEGAFRSGRAAASALL